LAKRIVSGLKELEHTAANATRKYPKLILIISPEEGVNFISI
jgi:hypothetical protein